MGTLAGGSSQSTVVPPRDAPRGPPARCVGTSTPSCPFYRGVTEWQEPWSGDLLAVCSFAYWHRNSVAAATGAGHSGVRVSGGPGASVGPNEGLGMPCPCRARASGCGSWESGGWWAGRRLTFLLWESRVQRTFLPEVPPQGVMQEEVLGLAARWSCRPPAGRLWGSVQGFNPAVPRFPTYSWGPQC